MSAETFYSRPCLGQFSFSVTVLNLETVCTQSTSIDRNSHRVTLFHRIIVRGRISGRNMLENS